jgi:hypothetical protein
MSSIDFDIRAENERGETVARWARGARLQLESGVFDGAPELDHDVLGSVCVLGDPHWWPCAELEPFPLVRAEFDLQPGLDRSGRPLDPGWQEHIRDQLLPLVTWCIGHSISAMVTDFLLAPPYGPVASQRELPAQTLIDAGWNTTELWLLTSASPLTVAKRVPWCWRCVKILYTESIAVFAWHPIDKAHDWIPESEATGLVIPLPECHRRHSYLTEIVTNDGPAQVGRLIQDILQHHEWTRWQVTEHVEAWERRFFGAARSGTFFEGIDSEPLGVDLDEVHMLVVALRKVNRDLDRRARLNWLPTPAVDSGDHRVESLREEIMIRAAAIQQNVDQLNGSLREGWTLLAGAATGKHFDLQRQSNALQMEAQRLQERFQNAATLITALILVPGLIVSLYGADVYGLPGYEKESGLLYIGLYALIAAATTGGCMRLLELRQRGWALRALIAGIIAFAVLTIIIGR